MYFIIVFLNTESAKAVNLIKLFWIFLMHLFVYTEKLDFFPLVILQFEL